MLEATHMGMKQTDVNKNRKQQNNTRRKDQEDTRKGSMNVRKQSAIQVAN